MNAVSLDALKAYYADRRVSASSIKCYAECPKKFEYRYVQKLPELEHDYFATGKRVEEELYRMLGADMEGYDDVPTEDQKAMAVALYNFTPFRALIDGKELTFQKEHYSETSKALTDIETDTDVIDIKTSASSWNADTVMEHKWQALHYARTTGKQFWFVIVNKKTLGVQRIKVQVISFGELDMKIAEMKLAEELGVFEPNPSYKCKMCDFRSTCDKDRYDQTH